MKGFLWKIYISRFLDSFILIGVIFALFFTQKGLNPLQISQLLLVWSITTVLSEVPFGVLADTYNRKNLLALGLVLRAIGFSFWLIGGYTNFAIGFILWGLKNTLTSGTLEALVYDELNYYKEEKLYEEVTGKMSSYFSAGLMLSAIFGGLIAQISFIYVLYLSIATSLTAAIILYTIKSVKSVRTTGETNYYSTLRHAILSVKQNKVLIYIISFSCIIFGVFGAADEYWSIIYSNLKLNESVIGILLSMVYGLGIAAGSTVKYFPKSSKSSGFIMIGIGGILYILFGLTESVILLPLIFVAIYLFQVANIKLDVQMQTHITTKERATISSIKSLTFELLYMVVLLIFGFVGNKYSIMSIVVLAGIFITIGTLFFYAKRPRILT